MTENGKPTLYLIGDSTIKNDDGSGSNGEWGWGSFISELFDQSYIQIENHALGARSSRSYRREGLWENVLSVLKPGDYVIIQFGHNDNSGPLDSGRARASLDGTGSEKKEVTIQETGEQETVRTYGWYIRQYIIEAKAKGAVPIICSPVPQNIWKNGRIVRASEDYGKWAREIAENESVFFIDLNEIIARHYDEIGEEAALKAKYFVEDHTHTNEAGARLNAASVVEGLKTLTNCSLVDFLSTES